METIFNCIAINILCFIMSLFYRDRSISHVCLSIPGNFHNPYASTIYCWSISQISPLPPFPKAVIPGRAITALLLFCTVLPTSCCPHLPLVLHLKLLSLPCLNSMSYTCPWGQLKCLPTSPNASGVILPLVHCTEVILTFFFTFFFLDCSNFFLASGSLGLLLLSRTFFSVPYSPSK